MSSEKMKKIFNETMIEIANQIKINSKLINKNDIVYLIDLILQIRNKKIKYLFMVQGDPDLWGDVLHKD